MILANYDIYYNNYKIHITFAEKSKNLIQTIVRNPNIDHGFAYFIPYDPNQLNIYDSQAVEQYVTNHPQFIFCFNSAVAKFPYVE